MTQAEEMFSAVLGTVLRIEAVYTDRSQAIAAVRTQADREVSELSNALSAEIKKIMQDSRPEQLRRRLEGMKDKRDVGRGQHALSIRFDYEGDFRQATPRTIPSNWPLHEAERQYAHLYTLVSAAVDDIAAKLQRWHQVTSAVRMFTENRLAPPRHLPQAFADDVVTLEKWAADLVNLRAADLSRRIEIGQQQIIAARDQEIRRLTMTADAALSRLLPDSASRLDGLVAASAVTARDWSDPLWPSAAPSRTAGAVDVRLGQFTVAGPEARTSAELQRRAPATLRFPFGTGVFIDGQGAARGPGISLARSLCARLLAAAPAGKLRFTFIDPVSLGQAVADFQHLADYDKQLVGNRPVTSPGDIEARLGELSAHTEMVISEYLRGQFDSIDEYNAAAGELAEAYRVLVVFDYPAGFSEQAAQQLLSLAENGPRCGVHTIVVTDGGREQPRDLPLDRLVQNQHCVYWKATDRGGRPEFSRALPAGRIAHEVVLDQAPPILFDASGAPGSPLAALLVRTGKQAQDLDNEPVLLRRLVPVLNQAIASGRSSILPRVIPPVSIAEADPATWWHGSTVRNAIATLGLSGAQDVAAMYFSSTDMASGAIMIGLPGSGKSTALHSSILTMCMLYGPEELELYLIDAKHGVEFKIYEQLPHARMVSINSEREFSVAILKSLDREIVRRAGLMKTRAAGRANITEFREATGDRMSRIVLIMDEFHEIFEEDDRLGHEAFQAFSNIVKQGRFAGVHVVVASQSLSNMPALDRPTLQLLPQRIAFRCNESDSDILMGDTNRGTRLLTKQGQGLFNPAGGEPSQNKPFQGLFVPSADRDELLFALRRKAAEAGWRRGPRVFDGDASAPRPALTAAPGGSRLQIPLGEPFSLDPFTAVTLRRTRSANLLIVGDTDDDELADGAVRAVIHSCLLAAAASGCAAGVVDFIGDEEAGGSLTVMEVARLTGAAYTRSRGVSELLVGLAAAVEERIAAGNYAAPGQLLVLVGAQRALSFQPVDPYAYDESAVASDAALLGKILREGPEVGVHVILSCDSVRSIERRLGGDVAGEFGLRAAGSAASPADLTFTAGGYGDVPEVRRSQLLIGDQLKGTVNCVRGYPLLTAAAAARAWENANA
jgi:DNA segregation ATPase FtsK/SpoIIIE, S-DNA-T family